MKGDPRKKKVQVRPRFFFLIGLPVVLGILLAFTERRDSIRPISSLWMKPHKYNVVLVVVDTLRADHLSCYGYKRRTSSAIDQWATQGVLFERAFVNLPFSLPAFTTIFTSLYPHCHGITAGFSTLSPKAVTLAEILGQNGWQTAAVVGAANLSSIFGVSQGFQFYDEPFNRTPPRTARRTADEVNRVAFEWLARRQTTKPFFLMVHYFDVHEPYTPPPNSGTRHSGGGRKLKKKELITLYDGEISHVDRQFRILVSKLEALKLLANTLIILTADHGRGLGDHNSRNHGENLYEQEVHIPLVLKGPGIPTALRVPALVQHVDLAPTILNLLAIPIPSEFQGVSFLPTLEGKKVRDYVLLERSTKLARYARQWAVRTENEKFIWSATGDHGFFDLQRDPEEQHNLFTPGNDRALRLFMAGMQYRSGLLPHPLKEDVKSRTPERLEVEEALKTLGYVNQ